MTATTSTERPRIKDFGNVRAWYFGNNPDIVPVCPPVVAPTWTLSIPNTRYNNRRRISLQQGGALASVTNATGYTVTKNGSAATIGTSFAPGDLFEITWTNTQASGTSIQVVFDVVSTTATIAPFFQPCRWTTIRNGTQAEIEKPVAFGGATVLGSALKGTAAAFAQYNTDGVAIQRFTGAGRMILEANGNGIEWAAGLLTTATPTWPGTNVFGFAHSFYISIRNDIYYVQEGSANPASINLFTLGQLVSPIMNLLCIYDDGTAIRYQRSSDSGNTWTTFYTSTQPYTPGRTWYVGVAGGNQRNNVLGPIFIESAGIAG